MTKSDGMPGAPYSGSFIGPGPLLDEIASTRSTSTSVGTISGSRDLEATLISLRFGPYVHYPVGDKWAFSLSAGIWVELGVGYTY